MYTMIPKPAETMITEAMAGLAETDGLRALRDHTEKESRRLRHENISGDEQAGVGKTAG